MKRQRRGRTTTEQAAQIIGLKPNTLEVYRHRGIGPKYERDGTEIFYKIRDLREWKMKSKAAARGLKTLKVIDRQIASLQNRLTKTLKQMRTIIERQAKASR